MEVGGTAEYVELESVRNQTNVSSDHLSLSIKKQLNNTNQIKGQAKEEKHESKNRN